MTKAKMPVIMRPGNTAEQAVCTGHWTDRREMDGTLLFCTINGPAA